MIGTQATSSPQITEFFSYNCPHCYSFEPFIDHYLESKPADLQFKRVPVGFGRSVWNNSARAFVLAKALGLHEELHKKLFIQVQELKRPFNSEKDIKAFFISHGVSEADYKKAEKSFTTKTLTRIHKGELKKNKITQVPTVIVNGKYQVLTSKKVDKVKFKELIDFLMTLD